MKPTDIWTWRAQCAHTHSQAASIHRNLFVSNEFFIHIWVWLNALFHTLIWHCEIILKREVPISYKLDLIFEQAKIGFLSQISIFECKKNIW